MRVINAGNNKKNETKVSSRFIKLSSYDYQRCVLLFTFSRQPGAVDHAREKRKERKNLRFNRAASRRDSLDRRKADKAHCARRQEKQKKLI